VFTFTNDGSLTYNLLVSSTDGNYDGDVKVMQLVISLSSGDSETINFTISFLDWCRIATLSMNSITATTTVELWTAVSVTVGSGVSDNITRDCGATTYVLTASDGSALGTVPHEKTLDGSTTKVTGTATNPNTEVKTYNYRITAYQGTFSTNTVFSNTFKIIVTNPCLTRSFDTQSLRDMTASISGTADVLSFSAFTGFPAECGVQTYSLEDGNGNTISYLTLSDTTELTGDMSLTKQEI